MTLQEKERELDFHIKAYLSFLRSTAQRGLLTWESVDLGRQHYGDQTPPDTDYYISRLMSHTKDRLIVGACCREVRDSRVSIYHTFSNFWRIDRIPMRDFTSADWWGGMWTVEEGEPIATWPGLWPGSWFLPASDQLEIMVYWNGKERPGSLVFCTLVLM